MSSILDALNKLEQEKAQASRESERSDTDPVSIANELVGRSMFRDRVTLRVTPATLLVSLGALSVGLIVITFAAAVVLTRSARETPSVVDQVAAAPAPAALTATGVQAPAAASVSVSAPEVAQPAAELKRVDLPASNAAVSTEAANPAALPVSTVAPAVEVPKPIETKPDTPVSAPGLSAPKPEKKETPPAEEPVVAKAGSAPAGAAAETKPGLEVKVPAATSRPRTRMAAKSADADETTARVLPGSRPTANRNEDVNLGLLPILTPVDQSRYGFIRLKVNMVKPAGDTNPQGSAILTLEEESEGGERTVNRMPFYEGQRLQQSPLRLFKVGPDRVGIEDMRTGDQYQLPI